MPYNAEQNQQDQQNQDPNSQQPQQQQQGQNLSGSGDTGTAVNAAGTGQAAPGAPQNPSGGSGRYTNLQKYIGANQGATDRLYQGITRRIDQTTSGQKQEAQTQAEKVKEGINQGNQTLQRGTGYYNQMQDPNFNAQDFASDTNRLQDYSQFRTGNAVDVNALNTQNTNAQTANLQAQNLYNQRLGQVGNEAGRFDLLKETFGGRGNIRPTYSTGQQRLDQLFLQSGAGNKVGQLQTDLQGNVNVLNRGLTGLKGEVANNILGIGNQQTDLSGNIQNRANTLETGYIDNIQGQVSGVNAARDAERKRYNDFVAQLLATGQGKETSQALDEQIFNEALLREGEQTFNFLKNPTLTTEQFQNIDTRNANDYRDIANQKNVDYYGALSKLAGINNSKLDKTGMLVDPATGGLVRAATIKTGEGSLREGITKAQEDFLKNAMNTIVTGEGRDSGSSGLFGGGSDAVVQLQQNLAKYLAAQGLNGQNVVTEYDRMQNGQQTAGDVIQGAYNYAPQFAGFNAAAQAFNSVLPGMGALGPGAMAGSILSGINSITGGSSGSSAAATARAKNDLLGQLNSILDKQGFNNYLTKSGIKNTDAIADRTTAADIDALEMDSRYGGRNANIDDQLKNFRSGSMEEKAFKSGILDKYTAQQLEQIYNDAGAGKDGGKFNQLLDEYVYSTNASGGLGSSDVRSIYATAQRYKDDLASARSNAEAQKAQQQRTYDQKMSEVNASKSKALDDMRAKLGLSNFNLATIDPDRVSTMPVNGENSTGTIKGPSMSIEEMRRRFAGK
jgi:hypothetical protein